MSWDPAQYEKFKRERDQPFWDLLALVQPRPGMRVADLGCGTGSQTQALHEKLAARETLGVDNSEAMLAKAQPLAGGGLRFERGDLATFGGSWDLIFSNAAFHWVPNHEQLLARMHAALAPGGQLAVQVPANFDSLAFGAAAQVAAELGLPPSPAGVLRAEDYARILFRLGFAEQQVRMQVYPHVLRSREDVIEWMTGTSFTPWRARPEFAEFLARYRERLPDEQPFFFPFKRILMWARRAAPASSG